MRDILKRGIGVHHSGVLPIMKEVCYGYWCTPQWSIAHYERGVLGVLVYTTVEYILPIMKEVC